MTKPSSWSDIEDHVPTTLRSVEELIAWHKMSVESLENLQDELKNTNANGDKMPIEYIDSDRVQTIIREHMMDWTSISVWGSRDHQNETILSEYETLRKLFSLIEDLPQDEK